MTPEQAQPFDDLVKQWRQGTPGTEEHRAFAVAADQLSALVDALRATAVADVIDGGVTQPMQCAYCRRTQPFKLWRNERGQWLGITCTTCGSPHGMPTPFSVSPRPLT